MATAVQYILPDEIQNAEKCMFKLSFGESKEKYFLFKALKLKPVIQSLSEQLYREYNKPNVNSILYKVVAYYKKHRPGAFHVSVISPKGLSVVDLLVFENKTLKQAENDANCLNIEFDNTKFAPRWVSHADIVLFKQKLKGKTTGDILTRLDNYLAKFIDNQGSKKKVVAYIKKNFM